MRRALILSVTYEKFSEKGYHTSMSEIAKDSGIKKQTLYNYFENKDELFYEVIKIETLHFFNVRQQQFRLLDEKDTAFKLEQIFKLLMDYFNDRSKYRFWRWLLLIDSEQLITKCDELTFKFKKDFFAMLNETFFSGIKNGEIRAQSIDALIHTFVALIHGTLDGLMFYESMITRESFINDVWDTFWNGISIKSK